MVRNPAVAVRSDTGWCPGKQGKLVIDRPGAYCQSPVL